MSFMFGLRPPAGLHSLGIAKALKKNPSIRGLNSHKTVKIAVIPATLIIYSNFRALPPDRQAQQREGKERILI